MLSALSNNPAVICIFYKFERPTEGSTCPSPLPLPDVAASAQASRTYNSRLRRAPSNSFLFEGGRTADGVIDLDHSILKRETAVVETIAQSITKNIESRRYGGKSIHVEAWRRDAWAS